jgi:hypothetical protein
MNVRTSRFLIRKRLLPTKGKKPTHSGFQGAPKKLPPRKPQLLMFFSAIKTLIY